MAAVAPGIATLHNYVQSLFLFLPLCLLIREVIFLRRLFMNPSKYHGPDWVTCSCPKQGWEGEYVALSVSIVEKKELEQFWGR